MTNKELAEKLLEFPEMEVIISDGYNLHFYNTDGININEFDGTIDIGVGGCEIE